MKDTATDAELVVLFFRIYFYYPEKGKYNKQVILIATKNSTEERIKLKNIAHLQKPHSIPQISQRVVR